jgi:hypothetical protein
MVSWVALKLCELCTVNMYMVSIRLASRLGARPTRLHRCFAGIRRDSPRVGEYNVYSEYMSEYRRSSPRVGEYNVYSEYMSEYRRSSRSFW